MATIQFKHMTVRLPKTVDRRLRLEAAERDVSKSELIREILSQAAGLQAATEAEAAQANHDADDRSGQEMGGDGQLHITMTISPDLNADKVRHQLTQGYTLLFGLGRKTQYKTPIDPARTDADVSGDRSAADHRERDSAPLRTPAPHHGSISATDPRMRVGR